MTMATSDGGVGGGSGSGASAASADAAAPLPRLDYAAYEPASLSAEYTQYEVGPGGALRRLPPTPPPPPRGLCSNGWRMARPSGLRLNRM